MLTEPIAIAVNNMAPQQPQARSPAVKGAPQKRRDDVKAEKPDLSLTTDLAAGAQKNLNMIHGVGLQFAVHEASGEIMVTVRNESTGEVIRQIPPQETLNLAAKLDAMVGLIFDQKG